MKNNLSQNLKNVLKEFIELSESNKLYLVSILLNHLYNGLINDGNYLSSDEAIENDKMVFEASDIELDDPMKLATNLLVIASAKEGITINPNGIDIEPYISDKPKKEFNDVLSKFYNLGFIDKIDFLTEIMYDISEIKEVEKINFDFNKLIDNLLTYSKNEFIENIINNLEI